MKRPSLLAGIAFAFVVAVFASPLWWGLKTTLPFFWAFRVAALVPYLAYCSYLLLAARARIGIITLSAANLVLGVVLFSLPVSNSLAVSTLAALVTLNRSLLFHRSLVSFASDGLVSGLGLLFAGYLFSTTGSVPAALWSFFLVQSVFTMIPARFSESGVPTSSAEKDEVDPFQRSQRQAHEALQRLVAADGN
jgi:hypothetical protein